MAKLKIVDPEETSNGAIEVENPYIEGSPLYDAFEEMVAGGVPANTAKGIIDKMYASILMENTKSKYEIMTFLKDRPKAGEKLAVYADRQPIMDVRDERVKYFRALKTLLPSGISQLILAKNSTGQYTLPRGAVEYLKKGDLNKLFSQFKDSLEKQFEKANGALFLLKSLQTSMNKPKEEADVEESSDPEK